MMIRVRDIKVQRLGDTVIANALGIGRASVYRLLGKQVTAVKANGSVDADQA